MAIVTGAGRGLGRSHALAMAAQGASVIVNDLAVTTDGRASSETPAEEVVDEICRMGGKAAVSRHDVAEWQDAASMIDSAVREFGGLDILVNNAGILRDRSLAKMTEREWDDVVRVHLKGHAGPLTHAMSYWRAEHKAGRNRAASVVNTTSISGLYPHFGQANYGAAKAGIVALSQVAAVEGGSIGVRSNAISPSAETRLVQGNNIESDNETSSAGGMTPEQVSPLVVWLAQSSCSATGQVFQVYGRCLAVYKTTTMNNVFSVEDTWTMEDFDQHLAASLVDIEGVDDALNNLLTSSKLK